MTARGARVGFSLAKGSRLPVQGMTILLTPARLDLLFKASPAGIVAVSRQTLAELEILAGAGLLESDAEGILHLTESGRQCIHVNAGHRRE